MILICDKTVSERAKKLRKKLYKLGIPCAVSKISDMKHFVPFKLIVTFSDVFDDVRRTPYDKIRVISIGEGFINSVMNAEKVLSEHELIAAIDRNFMKMFGISQNDVFKFGVKIKPNIFWSKRFMILNGKSVILANAEYMIFKYLLAFAGEDKLISPFLLYQYCFSVHRLEMERVANNVAVDVRKINQKCEHIFPGGLIKAKRGQGYYLKQI